MMNFKCPNCHSHKYINYGTDSTLAYYIPIYENGININPDRNIHTTIVECDECHKKFKVMQQYGVEDIFEEI